MVPDNAWTVSIAVLDNAKVRHFGIFGFSRDTTVGVGHAEKNFL